MLPFRGRGGLAGVGQGDQQRVIAPDALVGDVHALFAFAGRGHEAAIGLDARRLLEELLRLPAPDFDADIVDGVHQLPDRALVEAAAEVAGRRRVGDHAGAEHVEEGHVVAPHLDVVEHAPAAQRVERDVQDVVRLPVGVVDLEDVQSCVDAIDEPHLLGKPVDRREPAIGHGVDALRHVEAGSGAELRTDATRRHSACGLLEPSSGSPLPPLMKPSYLPVHLESPPRCFVVGCHPSKHRAFRV